MGKRPLIMAVDDETGVRRLLKRILEEEGYNVVLAIDGESALVLLERNKPDLILLDIMMPQLDGFQVLEFIRRRYDIPVIMLTGMGEVTAVRDALVLGADDYVRKPFYVRELLARIKAKLRRTGKGQLCSGRSN